MTREKPVDFAHPHTNVSLFGIEPGMTFADFGAGSGHYVFAVAELLKGTGHVYAVDVQRELLRNIYNDAQRRGFPNVSVLWGDLEKPEGSKLPAHSCDRILISNLLFQVEDKEAVVAEAGRVLTPDGTLIIIDWTDSFKGMGPPAKHVVNAHAAFALAKQHDFTLEREFAAGAHHYGILLSRGKRPRS